jgi:uncharacterized membrane protein
MTERIDSQVAEYLAQVSRATTGLPPQRRDELLRDLREHIESDRAELPSETEAQVREILERLGDPDVIARAAAEDTEAASGLGVMPNTIGDSRAVNKSTPATRNPHRLKVIVAIAVVIALFALCAGLLFFTQTTETGAAM